MRKSVIAWGVLIAMSFASQGWGGEIDFREDFALSQDRAVTLKQLVPGTEDYYYFHALHYLSQEQWQKVEQLFAPWIERHGETERVWQIRTRYALLTYDKQPKKSLEFLRNRLGLSFPHERELIDAEPDLPKKLDPASVSRMKFQEQAAPHSNDNFEQYENSALEWLLATELNPNQRRSLLAKLTRPDVPNLVKLIVADLNHEHSGGFGSLGIHNQLLLSQLEELLTLKPEVLNHQAFVAAYLQRLQPLPDEDFRHDSLAMTAYLDRLSKFAARLAPVHNSLKAHVLYQQLLLGRTQGKYDRALLLEYLKLPRPVGYLSKAIAESEALKRFACDLNSNYNGVTLLPAIGNDEPLVRSYLAELLKTAANTKEFEPYVNDVYLKHLFAEVKIVNGLGEPEQWASLLPPALFQQLKERVDIDFALTNATRYGGGDPVVLELFTKNVNTLIVKVFEINTKNFYRTELREISTDINLDGLVANHEEVHKYADSPLVRKSRKFAIPQLNKPGIYIVDFIGNGRSSRALIHKGRLRQLVRTTAAGQRFSIFDERNQPIKDASLWLAGHAYEAAKDGTITVPFSTNPGRVPVVISARVMPPPLAGKPAEWTEYSSLDYFDHQGEAYELTAGFYVDREALLPRRTAKLVLRAGLKLNGIPVSTKLLKEVKLLVHSIDLDGIPSTQEIPDAAIYEDRESVLEFQVPARLATIRFHLSAKVDKVTVVGEKAELNAEDSFALNEIERTEKIEDLHLLKNATGYVVELRGKTGEAKISRPVTFQLKHRDFKQPLPVTLKSDPQGRITLGAMTDIAWIEATGPEQLPRRWPIEHDAHTYPAVLHGKTGDVFTLPYLPQRAATAKPAEDFRKEVSLLELRGEAFVADRSANVSVKNGLLTIGQLPAGDYDLYLKSLGHNIRVRVAPGEKFGRYVLGQIRQLETPQLAPVQIESITVKPGKAKEKDKPAEDNVVIQLRNASKFTRVHLFATRYEPQYSAFQQMAHVRGAGLTSYTQSSAESVFLSGRNIGDEYRYIIDRKYAPKFPGNSLERPSLLLNPWAIRETETGKQTEMAGEDYLKRMLAEAGGAGRIEELNANLSLVVSPNSPNLDFLAFPAAVAVNLIPDENGVVEIEKSLLGSHQRIQVIAVDPENVTARSIALEEPKVLFADLRLMQGLDPAGHFTQQKQITIVPAGKTFTLHDLNTSKFEVYDSLARVYTLYKTLALGDEHWEEFAFILNWPKLKAEEKKEKYSKYASHEMNFFLFKKDPEFFKTVVQPYLAHKKDKTFLDHFLLESDLRPFLRPWKYGQLNTVERILLAQRIKEEGPHTARFAADQFKLLPPNVEDFIRRFDTAISARAMEMETTLGLAVTSVTWDETSAVTGASGMGQAGGMGGGGGMLGRSKGSGAHFGYIAPADPAAPANEPELRAMAESIRVVDKLEKAAELMDERGERDDKAARWGAIQGKDGNYRRQRGLQDLQKNFDDFRTPMGALSLEYHDADGTEMLTRESIRQLYRQLDKTQEWAENNYHHLTIDLQNTDLITISAFWRDFAQHDPKQPFYSQHLAAATTNFSEMMYALAVLDLPFESPKHETKIEGNKLTLTPGGPLVVFHEEVKPAAVADGAAKVLVSQNFFRHGDRQREEDGEMVDKFITEEFVVHTVYGCQIVVTNPTSAKQKLNLLVEIPRGAMPVLGSKATKTVYLQLEPYNTQTLEYHFYFPAAGKFAHFPVHVAQNEKLIASVQPFTFNVVAQATKIDKESWDYVSQHGTTEQVLTFLDKQNIHGIDLERIAWRMKDAKVFSAVLEKLTQRHAYDHELWSYALLHNVPAAAREFLQHADELVQQCGGRLQSTLLVIDPIERREFEHLEYKPLVNSRAHALGKRRQIVNDRFHEQYHLYLQELCFDGQLNEEDWLAVTYYLLLQDRVEEALATFARVKPANTEMKLQYEYLAAYLDFFSDDPKQARAIALKYANHPVDRWRNTFAAIIAQLDEAEGKDAKAVDKEDKTQQQTQLAATEPSFEFVVEAKKIKLDYQNLTAARVSFYEMDVELLFSRNPFVQQFQGQFSAIRPNSAVDLKLPADKATLLVDLPAALQGKNVVIEITAGGQTKAQPYYSHSLAVQVIENYGQVRVTQQTTEKPVPKAYVKVYAQLANGEVKFYKDGYTDLRGRFDYASLNSNDLDSATKFSLLILSDEFGAVVKEATPPKE